MILKQFEYRKIDLNKNTKILFYGNNDGLKKEAIKNLTAEEKIFTYDEFEILNKYNEFILSLSTKSFFETRKIILVNNTTEKILKIIEEIDEKRIDNIIIIINAQNLDKKSKLRNLFEKDKGKICIPFYPDNEKTLLNFTYNFLKERNMILSTSNINLLIDKCANDRGNLINELNKIEFFYKSKKKITFDDIIKLTNLAENYTVSELVDNCLAKNIKKTTKILNENIFAEEDVIIIIRTFLNKCKKLLNLSKIYENNKNIDLVISSARPPIFWKDKEITKKQLLVRKPSELKELIYKISNLELLIKKNFKNSLNFVVDFLLENSDLRTNNKI